MIAGDRTPTEGQLIYAIGDVHGRADLLSQLLEIIRSDMRSSAEMDSKPLLIFLGDYIDRGPNSREAIALILAMQEDDGWETISLIGNHEKLLLDFLEEKSSGKEWRGLGGLETLASYQVRPKGFLAEDWRRLRTVFVDSVPESHLCFLRTLRLALRVGDYFFVHAGCRPGVPLEEQSEKDLLWIREPFLSSAHPCPPFVVVHGHTPSDTPVRTPGRIGIDTGAYITGRLSAVRLQGASVAFASTGSEHVHGFREAPIETEGQPRSDGRSNSPRWRLPLFKYGNSSLRSQ